MKHLEMYPTGAWGFGTEGKSKVDVREPEDRPSARVGHGGGVLEGQRDAGVTGLGWARTKGMARTGSKWSLLPWSPPDGVPRNRRQSRQTH